ESATAVLLLQSDLLSLAFLARPPRNHHRRNPAARTEFAFHFGPHRLSAADDILQNLIHDVLLEDAEVAIRLQIFFQRLQLQAPAVGHVADHNIAKIRQASLRADRREFGIVDHNFVGWKLVGPGLDFGKVMIEPGAGVLVGVAGRSGTGRLSHSIIVPSDVVISPRDSRRSEIPLPLSAGVDKPDPRRASLARTAEGGCPYVIAGRIPHCSWSK